MQGASKSQTAGGLHSCRYPQISANPRDNAISPPFLWFQIPTAWYKCKGHSGGEVGKHCWHPNSRHFWCGQHVGQSATSCHLRGLFCWSLHLEVHLLCFFFVTCPSYIIHTSNYWICSLLLLLFLSYPKNPQTLSTVSFVYLTLTPQSDFLKRWWQGIWHPLTVSQSSLSSRLSIRESEFFLVHTIQTTLTKVTAPCLASRPSDLHGRMGYGFDVHTFGNVSAPFWIHDNTCIWFSFEIFLQTLYVVISADFSFLSSLLFTLQFSPIFTLWGILCMQLTPLEIQTNTLTLHEASPKFNFSSSP